MSMTLGKTISELRKFVDELALSAEVMELLLPKGAPHSGEKQLWDYKEKLPVLSPRPTDEDRKSFNAEIGDIIKDVVAFNNAYGGYIIFGVKDKGSDRLIGCTDEFDCGDFNKRLKSYIGDSDIECHFETVASNKNRDISFGVLLVPRRPDGAPPTRFIKEGPQKPNGGRSFNKEVYIRVRDECRPAANNYADWSFLFSNRAPDKEVLHGARGKVASTLPSRDADLIEFVGREVSLSDLRRWFADRRSPVRLVTGIGGLGKTTLAYKFAEEVAETVSGEIDQIIWLTAKMQTFSALRGRMVVASRVDFHDIRSLYLEILKTLKYQQEYSEDEIADDELSELVVDALTIMPSLIVVDDIDSLSPSQQKEVSASLNTIAQRTVGRELAPSRILMTSRIDQGFPSTSVIKLTGLARSEFDLYVTNVCAAFGINNIYGKLLDSLYEASSGSPLFAASIVRLIRLGENVQSAIDSWRGQDGEEVRQFAFKREIERLGVNESKILFAVILLGETSINDISRILDQTPKIVRERIAELQSYHLLSVATSINGETTIFASGDLVSVAPTLKSHLGHHASVVEKACAQAEELGRSSSRAIGHSIRNIVDCWGSNRAGEGLIIAKKLREQHPDNADIACILGASLIKVSPPRYKEADGELEFAFKNGCARPELISYMYQTKRELEDWQGLYIVSKTFSSNDQHRDEPLDAFLASCYGIVKSADVRGDNKRIREITIEAIEKINKKCASQHLKPSYFASLNGTRLDFGKIYMNAIHKDVLREADRINIFEGVYRLSEQGIYSNSLTKEGLSALDRWWSAVERRPIVDNGARTKLSGQLRRLERMISIMTKFDRPNHALIEVMRASSLDLGHRGANYSR